MKYTMDDILRKSNAMEAWRTVLEENEFAINREFDPRAMSHEDWKAEVFPVVKLFIRDLTMKNFKNVLEEHRNLYNEREKKREGLKQKRPCLFRYIDNRVCPLKEMQYEETRTKLEKKKKIRGAVLFFCENKFKLIGDEDAKKIIAEKSKKSEPCAENC